ncbi:hypothetical protein SLEP1_g47496 [Rubroshorea leprosula]|uniref:Uncharacterized protein n=1 Tax=Rubroshorea leprosula TaxID=152421 RepID=A0AAV5LRH8_9ROSI|nr:hypothetical protein SLEP1_g47496 [Rubroshorea leprosula]
MLGFSRLTCISPPRIPGISQRPTYLLPHDSCSPFLKTQFRIPSSPSRFALFAQSGNNDLIKESGEKERPSGFVNGDVGDFDSKKDRRPVFNFRRGDLLDPDPENILAVGLTGLLGWASAQVLWQLFFISVAILVAALLIFILITLLLNELGDVVNYELKMNWEML